MTDGEYVPDPDDAADDELAAERARQSTTAEEAMDEVTDEAVPLTSPPGD